MRVSNAKTGPKIIKINSNYYRWLISFLKIEIYFCVNTITCAKNLAFSRGEILNENRRGVKNINHDPGWARSI